MARAVAGDSRTALAAQTAVDGQGAILWEDNVAGQFVFDSSDLSAFVTLDTRQALFIPPASAPTGAAGAWVRKFAGPIELAWFRPAADDATDDGPVFASAFRLAEALAVTGYINGTIFRGGPAIHIPVGTYYSASSLEPLATLRIYGDGGLGWGASTQIRFPAGVSGLIAQAHNTSGDTDVDVVQHYAGDALVIQDIAFLGGFTDTEGEYHGVNAKRVIHLERCTIDGFQGDGLFGHTSFGGGAPTEGNTNVLRATDCVFTNCRSGLHAEGADANAWSIVNCSFINNRRWGREDRSFLGNHEFGSHYDGNGRTAWSTGAAGRPISYCEASGHLYFAIDGQETGASTNAPSGTTADNTWWAYWQDGAASPGSGMPTWSSGIAVRSGGPFLISGGTNASSVYGPHVEINGISQADQLATVLGGNPAGVAAVGSGAYSRNRARVIAGHNEGLNCYGSFIVRGDFKCSTTAEQGDLTADINYNLKYLNGAGIVAYSNNAGSPNYNAQIAFNGFYLGLFHLAEHRTYIGTQFGASLIASTDTTGIKLEAGKVLKVNGLQVVGAQGAAITDASNAVAAPTKAEFDALVGKFNTLLARLRAATGHGLIA